MPSVSEKQKRFMAAAAHNKSFAKKVGIAQNVAKEFNRADAHHAVGGEVKKHMKKVEPKMPKLPPQLAMASQGAAAPPNLPSGPASEPDGGMNAGMKKGGMTHKKRKTHHMAKGGMTRGDGIAERGHTRGVFR